MLRPREVFAALLRGGFVHTHSVGSHRYLWNPTTRKMTSVPFHARDVKRGTLKKILRDTGITDEEFLKLLKGK